MSLLRIQQDQVVEVPDEVSYDSFGCTATWDETQQPPPGHDESLELGHCILDAVCAFASDDNHQDADEDLCWTEGITS